MFFRNEALRARMTFDVGPWPLGRMVTPTLAGTRPGVAIAAAWAVMIYRGVDGYERRREQRRARLRRFYRRRREDRPPAEMSCPVGADARTAGLA